MLKNKFKRRQKSKSIWIALSGLPLLAVGLSLFPEVRGAYIDTNRKDATQLEAATEARDFGRGGYPLNPSNLREIYEIESLWDSEIIEKFCKKYPHSMGQFERYLMTKTIGADQRHEIAFDFDIRPELADALGYQESGLEHLDSEGNPKRSNSDAFGEKQVTRKGFEEVWNIYRSNGSIYRGFAREFGDSIEKYSHVFQGSKEEAWERVKKDPFANRVAGLTLLGYYKHKEGGAVTEALKDYFAGPTGKLGSDRAHEYTISVLGHKEFYASKCREIEGHFKEFRSGIAESNIDAKPAINL
jgi:hypothetical protein